MSRSINSWAARVALAVFLQSAVTSLAQFNEQVTTIGVTNYTGLIIRSDASLPAPAYNRESILVSTRIAYNSTLPAKQTFAYQIVFELLNSAGAPVPILDAAGVPGTSFVVEEPGVTLPIKILGFTIPSTSRLYGASLKPVDRLSPYDQYSVKVSILERPGASADPFTDSGVSATEVPRTYHDFTSLDSIDAPVNVIPTLDSCTFGTSFLVDTIPAKNAFELQAGFTLRRYDAFMTFPTSDNVSVRLDYQLIEADSNAVVPLTESSTTLTKSIATHGIALFGFPIPPTTVSFTETLKLRPAVQLNSVDKLYKVVLTISHVEVAGDPFLPGNALTTVDNRILHFNGNLSFGPIQTQFTSIANVPPVGLPISGGLPTMLAVDGNSGFVVGKPTHTYGSGAPLQVTLHSNGDAEFTGPFPIALNTPVPDTDVLKNVRFERLATTLGTAGGKSDIKVILPAGFGYRFNTSSRILQSTLAFSTVDLRQDLSPASDLTFAGVHYACEETKPFWIETSAMTWETSRGQFRLAPTGNVEYVREKELSQLESVPLANPSMKFKRSNEQYFRFLGGLTSSDVLVRADENGVAEMSCEVKFKAGSFVNHFPYDSEVSWTTGGVMAIKNDLVIPSSSHLEGVGPIDVSYARVCATLSCGPGKLPEHLALSPTASTLTFTPDGGLTQAGEIVVPKPLAWGWIDEPTIQRYVHEVEAFKDATFHMPGVFLVGKQTKLLTFARPAVLLFTGTGPVDPGDVERFGTDAYKNGLGDYAGLNFRVASDGAKTAESVLAGKPTGSYPLRARGKYYVRPAGVSGIHEAVFGAFPPNAQLYGYDFKFSNFGLSYLDGENIDSRTQGSAHIKYPSDFDQNFEELKFNCLGALTDAKVPASESGTEKELAFWKADFKTLAIKFDRKDSAICDPGEGFLTLGVQAWAQHVDSNLHGVLGFKADGNLITLSDALLDPPFNSRLKLPNSIKIKGPGSEEYAFTPVNDAYYNNWDDYKSEPGFINIAGKLDVPFFEDLRVHAHVGADKDATGPLHLMGGWPAKGFEITAGNNFFTENPSDKDNRGFPTDTTVENYHLGNNDGHEKYLVRAQRNWLGFIDLDYPMRWSSTTRAFTAFAPVSDELLVLDVQHEAKYISPKNVELKFGAQYTGLPQINLANLAFDELGGVANALNETIGDLARGAIDQGMRRLDEMLDAQIHGFMDPALDELIDPVVHNLYQALQADYAAGANAFSAGNPADLVHQYCFGSPTVGEHVLKRLNGIIDGAAPGHIDVLKRIDDDLEAASNAIAKIRSLLAKSGPDNTRQITAKLVKDIVGQLAAEFVGSIVDAQLAALLEKADPTLNEIDHVLGTLQDALADLRGKLAPGQEFALELKKVVTDLAADINGAVAQVQADINGIFGAMNLSIDNPFQHYTEAQLKALIRQKIEDRFFASKVASSLQKAIKHRLYDLDASIREATDSLFQQVNVIIKDVISKSLAEVDNTINSFLDGASGAMGAGKIDGYAHITGDSLKLLRLDMYAQFKIPSEMEFNAFLQIKELTSDGSPGACPLPNGKAVEVTAGATDVEIDWISPGTRATLIGKFTFDPAPPIPVLINLGASLELTGEISFETFKIKYLAAALNVGAIENNFSCAARIAVNKYEGFGGLMFGKACSTDPFFWDPDIKSIMGDPPFTGAYVYGEVWIPISEALLGIPASCFFQISAGMGAGAGFFIEGPTFVGKMLLGVEGEVLCLVSVGGEVKLVGKANPHGLVLKGTGTVHGDIGPCPFCVSFKKSVGLTYQNNDWDLDF